MKKVTVLLSTYNGEKFIKHQIQSLLAQRGVDLQIVIRDDGSTDETIRILKSFNNNKIKIIKSNENLGPAKSFINLLNIVGDSDYYAFCDQDDYWEENKLLVSISKLEKIKSTSGKLYISSLNVTDSNLNTIYVTQLLDSAESNPAMVRNQATGCTMVFDKILENNFVKHNFNVITMHDSFIYKYAILCHASVYLDNNSYIKYRQHSNNTLGMTNNFIKSIQIKLNRVLHSDYDASQSAKEFLKKMKLNDYNVEYLDCLVNYKKDLKKKLKLLTKFMIKTNYSGSKINYVIKILINKI